MASTPSKHLHPWDVFILLISIYVLMAMVAFEVLESDVEMMRLFDQLDFIVCLIFFIDFCRRLKSAPNRKHYFFTWGWIDLLSSIPAVSFFRWGRLVPVIRFLRLMRAFKSAHELTHYLIQQRRQSAILAAGCLLLFAVFMGSILILKFEAGSDSRIDTSEEALWWAVATMTTVGYGDVVPVTTAGRIVAGFMMVAGICLLAILTGAFASWFTAHEQHREDLTSIRKDLNRIKEKLGIQDD